LQCVAVCCSVLQCVAVCCSALQCVAAPPYDGGPVCGWKNFLSFFLSFLDGQHPT